MRGKRPTKKLLLGGELLLLYFLDQREKFGDFKGDSLKKMADRLHVTKSTLWRLTRNQPTSYPLAKKIQDDLHKKGVTIPWQSFQLGRHFPPPTPQTRESAGIGEAA